MYMGKIKYVLFVALSATLKAFATREVRETSRNDQELKKVRKAIELDILNIYGTCN